MFCGSHADFHKNTFIFSKYDLNWLEIMCSITLDNTGNCWQAINWNMCNKKGMITFLCKGITLASFSLSGKCLYKIAVLLMLSEV